MEKATYNQSHSTPKESTHAAQDSELNLAKAYAIWGRQFNNVEDLFLTKTDFIEKSVIAQIHFSGMKADTINLIPYDNSRGADQPHIKKHIGNGEIAISIKHHSPAPEENENIKLQCTHIQIVVGTADGVITINNPQDYEYGLFGREDYPMIFVKPRLPKELSIEQQKDYINNIRTWLIIANTFTKFPRNFDGGDPLKCIDKESILKMGHALLGAILGNESDIDWLQQPEQLIYCAELASLALNLGLHFPLNSKYVGSSFAEIKEALDSAEFLENNKNTYAKTVDICCAPENLLALNEVILEASVQGKFWNGLALQPFCIADMIEQYIQRTVPRASLGEQEGAKYQSMMFEQVRPKLKEFLKIDSEELLKSLDVALEKISKIVATPHTSYQAFRSAIGPILKELSEVSLKYGNIYVPPHCFLIRATDSISGIGSEGVLKWEYIGHGMHSSLFQAGVE